MIEPRALAAPAMPETTTARASVRICIAIPTFRRPQMLAELLRGIALQAMPRECSVEVVVIDNDTRPSVEHLVRAMIDDYPFALAYAHESSPGLSSVRNFALAYARDRFDFLAMIDDDEYPEPQWLREFVRVQESTGADGVIGPVPAVLPPDAPRWLRAGRFHELPSSTDGARIAFGYSGNCFLRVAALARYGMAFDPVLNLAGGEDLLFFRQFVARGGRLAYAARAVASETMGPDRLRASYVIELNFRRGNTLSICDRLQGDRALLVVRAVKSCARLALGVASLLPLSLFRGRAGAVRALCDIARGLGSMDGLLGRIYQAYERDDARG